MYSENSSLETYAQDFVTKFDEALESKYQTLQSEFQTLNEKAEEFKIHPVDKISIKQETFIEIAKAMNDELGEITLIEKRLLCSDVITVYTMLVDGYLDIKLEEAITEHPDENPEVLRIALITQIIEKSRNNNQEEIIRAQNESMAMGLEIETSFSVIPYRLGYKNEPMIAENALHKAKAIRAGREDYGAVEIKLRPSSTPQTNLKELLTIIKDATSEAYWGNSMGLHETFSNIELSPDHLEVMDLYALERASGLIRGGMLFVHVDYDNPGAKHLFTYDADEKVLKEIEDGLTKGIAIDRETVNKISKIGEQYYYFPRHKVRPAREIVNYPRVIDDTEKKAVERRTGIQVGKTQFGVLAKEVITADMAMQGIEAVQIDNKNDELKQAYEQMIAEWTNLQKEYGIERPEDKECYLGPFENEYAAQRAVKKQYSEAGSKNPYDLYINKILVTTAKDQEFRKKAYAIVRDYRVKFRELA